MLSIWFIYFDFKSQILSTFWIICMWLYLKMIIQLNVNSYFWLTLSSPEWVAIDYLIIQTKACVCAIGPFVKKHYISYSNAPVATHGYKAAARHCLRVKTKSQQNGMRNPT